ncbi:MAG TPA: class I SAM-dependent methyltransferase, partial [Lapillicoccus sp.]|nr:class I SAM-dependent methyltransferase [Lapillicoccus sp.]
MRTCPAARSSGPSSRPTGRSPARARSEVALTATDWDGGRYRRVNSLQQWLAARAIEGVDLAGVHRLLDVGCGDGRITESLVDRIPGGQGVGIDPSPRMIAVAPSSDRLTFEAGSAETMTFRDAFDLVVSFNALHWVQDQTAALAAIAVALHTAGRATLVFVCDGPRPSIEDVAMSVTSSPQWAGWFGQFSAPYVHPDPVQWQ